MKVVVIDGGAGGSSFAARMRRLDDKAQITVLEKSAETSIASCGLPYFIGNVITERSKMQVTTPDVMKKVFNIDVRLNSEAVKIDVVNKKVLTKNNEVFEYDKLVLSTGAKAFVPSIDGLENLPYFTVKSLADADKIKAYISSYKPQTAVVIGGGFIGVEVAELAGVPQAVISRAKEISKNLEKVNQKLDLDIFAENKEREQAEKNSKLGLKLLSILKDIDMNRMSPMESFEVLNDLVEKVKEN